MSDIKQQRVRLEGGRSGVCRYGHVIECERGEGVWIYVVRILDGTRDVVTSGELTWNPSEWPTDTGVMHGPELPDTAAHACDRCGSGSWSALMGEHCTVCRRGRYRVLRSGERVRRWTAQRVAGTTRTV